MDYSKCTKAYKDTISNFGDFPLEMIRAEKERRGYGNSQELYQQGLSENQLKQTVIQSFAAREQAKCSKNPIAYELYGGRRNPTRKYRKKTRKYKKKIRKTRKN